MPNPPARRHTRALSEGMTCWSSQANCAWGSHGESGREKNNPAFIFISANPPFFQVFCLPCLFSLISQGACCIQKVVFCVLLFVFFLQEHLQIYQISVSCTKGHDTRAHHFSLSCSQSLNGHHNMGVTALDALAVLGTLGIVAACCTTTALQQQLTPPPDFDAFSPFSPVLSHRLLQLP